MPVEGCRNCWEFCDCPKECKDACLAHQLGAGGECFHMAHSYQPNRKREFNSCFDCLWFKSLNPNLVMNTQESEVKEIESTEINKEISSKIEEKPNPEALSA